VQQISTHWLRRTTLTWVERSFGYAVARAPTGHTDSGGEAGRRFLGRRSAGRWPLCLHNNDVVGLGVLDVIDRDRVMFHRPFVTLRSMPR
jgi:hypothetical protein